MTSLADRRAALLAQLADLGAAYRGLVDLPLPDESSDVAVKAYFAACDRLMGHADRAGAAFAIEKVEFARLAGIPAFTQEALAPFDPDLAGLVTRLTAEATECLKRQAARTAEVAERMVRVRDRIQKQIGQIANGLKVRKAYNPDDAAPSRFCDRKE